MTRERRRCRWKVVNVCLISCLARTASAVVLPNPLATDPLSIGLFSRDATDSCAGGSGFQTCGNGLPSDWCCSTGNTCIPLNNTGAAAAICCSKSDPNGCSTIRPISCDISQQDASANPQTQLFTQDLSKELESCGSGTCCPSGYSCEDNSCVMNDETKQSPAAKAPSSSPSTSADLPTSTIPSSISPTPSNAIPDQTPANATPTPQQSSDYPARAVLAGLFPGIIVGALLCAIVFFFLRQRSSKRLAESERDSWFDIGPRSRRSQMKQQQRRPQSPQRQGRNISDPIYNAQTSNRTDFLKHTRSSDGTSSDSDGKAHGPVTPDRSQPWYRSPRLGMGTWSSTLTAPTFSTPSPHKFKQNRPAMQDTTPTPQSRSILYPHGRVPGLAVTSSTPSNSSVKDIPRPLSPALPPSIQSLHHPMRASDYANPEMMTTPNRNNSNKTVTTIASRSTSGRNPSRRGTAASGETINFLLAPSAMSASLPLAAGFNGYGTHAEGSGWSPNQTPEVRPTASLGTAWSTPSFSARRSPSTTASPRPSERAGRSEERLTTFTNLMLDAGYPHGSPGTAVTRIGG